MTPQRADEDCDGDLAEIEAIAAFQRSQAMNTPSPSQASAEALSDAERGKITEIWKRVFDLQRRVNKLEMRYPWRVMGISDAERFNR